MANNKKTISEILFEDFCNRCQIQIERISTSEIRTPDYKICLPGEKIIVEIKQIDMNRDEKREYEKLCKGDIAKGSNTIGKRVGKKISDANQQLAILTSGKLPSICIIYDNTPLGYHTDPNNIRFGMYGLATAIIAKPSDRRIKPYIKEWKFGPKRKMTRTTNTSTSAVAAMFREIDNPEHPPYLVLYHNVFAKVRMKPEPIAKIGVRQFTLDDDVEGKYQEWVEINN